jgi:hypothetical protein
VPSAYGSFYTVNSHSIRFGPVQLLTTNIWEITIYAHKDEGEFYLNPVRFECDIVVSDHVQNPPRTFSFAQYYDLITYPTQVTVGTQKTIRLYYYPTTIGFHHADLYLNGTDKNNVTETVRVRIDGYASADGSGPGTVPLPSINLLLGGN